MGDSRTKLLTRHLRGYDRKLYAVRVSNGCIHVYRESTGFYPFEYDGISFLASYSSPNFILALTDDWTIRGRPVEWGVEPLMRRIQEIDCWRDDRIGEKLLQSYSKSEETKQKDLRNKNEAFFADQRSEFKKAFKDINVSHMDMKKGF